jgi:hypothetical protein
VNSQAGRRLAGVAPDSNGKASVARRFDEIRTVTQQNGWGFSISTPIALAMLATGREVACVEIDYLPRPGRSKIRLKGFFRFVWPITKPGLPFHPGRILFPLGLAGPLVWGAGLPQERARNGGGIEPAGD